MGNEWKEFLERQERERQAQVRARRAAERAEARRTEHEAAMRQRLDALSSQAAQHARNQERIQAQAAAQQAQYQFSMWKQTAHGAAYEAWLVDARRMLGRLAEVEASYNQACDRDRDVLRFEIDNLSDKLKNDPRASLARMKGGVLAACILGALVVFSAGAAVIPGFWIFGWALLCAAGAFVAWCLYASAANTRAWSAAVDHTAALEWKAPELVQASTYYWTDSPRAAADAAAQWARGHRPRQPRPRSPLTVPVAAIQEKVEEFVKSVPMMLPSPGDLPRFPHVRPVDPESVPRNTLARRFVEELGK
jgi:hypothetical protein